MIRKIAVTVTAENIGFAPWGGPGFGAAMKRVTRVLAWVVPVVLPLGGCVSHPASTVVMAPAAALLKKPVAVKEAVRPKAAVPLPVAQVAEISLEDFLPLQQQGSAAVLIYDARPAFVRAFGRIPGSVGWPRSSFNSDWAAHEPEIRASVAARKPVVIYCTDLECPDARAVADKVAAKGYPVAVLKGGYGGWKEAGMPVE